jgi:uncharacterized protein YijF (DUF1287 family)
MSATTKKVILIFICILAPATNVFCDTKDKFVSAAIERTKHSVTYDGSYVSISYPNGDVPNNIGVCADVIIRAYRKIGIDLQKLVHEDMKMNFSKYPSKRVWGLNKPDTNIDHRRVLNLQVFFSRHGKTIKVSDDPKSYLPGDIVVWIVPENLPHIGVVTDRYSFFSRIPKIIHNIGKGPVLENMLFDYKIIGHYRYFPEA